jgi:ferredoxin
VTSRQVSKVSAHQVTFQMPKGSRTVEVAPGTYILDAALKAGVDLPYSCKSGGCAACCCKVPRKVVHIPLGSVPQGRSLRLQYIASAEAR